MAALLAGAVIAFAGAMMYPFVVRGPIPAQAGTTPVLEQAA